MRNFNLREFRRGLIAGGVITLYAFVIAQIVNL
jgi:hypothetical protein